MEYFDFYDDKFKKNIRLEKSQLLEWCKEQYSISKLNEENINMLELVDIIKLHNDMHLLAIKYNNS